MRSPCAPACIAGGEWASIRWPSLFHSKSYVELAWLWKCFNSILRSGLSTRDSVKSPRIQTHPSLVASFTDYWMVSLRRTWLRPIQLVRNWLDDLRNRSSRKLVVVCLQSLHQPCSRLNSLVTSFWPTHTITIHPYQIQWTVTNRRIMPYSFSRLPLKSSQCQSGPIQKKWTSLDARLMHDADATVRLRGNKE